MEPFFNIPDADVSAVRRKWLDIPYASASPAHQLDICLPEAGDGPFPVLLRIHGGGFELGDKRDIGLTPFLSGIERGYAVASANYRLSGEAKFPAAVQDVKAAVRWLRANAAQFRLDPARIAAAGESAGGHLVAMLCASAGAPLFEDPALGNAEQSSAVQAGVDWFGPIDLLAMDAHFKTNGPPADLPGPVPTVSPETKYLGAPVDEVPDLARQSDPTTYLSPAMPPLLVQHGSADLLVPLQQSADFVQAVAERAGPGRCEFDILAGAGHGSPEFETPENVARVFAFLDRHLRS